MSQTITPELVSLDTPLGADGISEPILDDSLGRRAASPLLPKQAAAAADGIQMEPMHDRKRIWRRP